MGLADFLCGHTYGVLAQALLYQPVSCFFSVRFSSSTFYAPLSAMSAMSATVVGVGVTVTFAHGGEWCITLEDGEVF